MSVPAAPPMTRMLPALPSGNGNGNGQAAPPFDRSTRWTLVKQAPILRPAGGGMSPDWQFPTYGLIGGVLLEIRGAIGGTVGAVNALGMSIIIQRVTVRMNSGTVVFSMTGSNYQYLYRPIIDSGFVDVLGQNNSGAAVTATNAILDMIIPLQVNLRDPIGLLLLQNRQTVLTLSVQWTPDAVVTATGTFTGFSVIPHLIMYSVPPNPMSLPPLRYVHTIVDQDYVQSGAGQWVYDIPRGNTYMSLIHGCGIGVAGSDLFSTAQVRVNQANYIWDSTPNSQDLMFRYLHGRTRNPGAVYFDFSGTSGLGKYGTTRDFYDSNRTTSFQSVIQATGAATINTVREELVDLRAS